MQKGKKVVCVNDKFEPDVAALYQALPKKDVQYTVREVTLGRERLLKFGADGKWVSGGASEESLTVRILLEELINEVDATHKGKQELGFNAERFREIEEESDTEFNIAYASNVGTLVEAA